MHYLDIATKGYFGTDMAFFPLYPLLIAHPRTADREPLDRRPADLEHLALLRAALSSTSWSSIEYNRPVAHRAIFYVSIFPTAIFFSAVYTESLFFVLTVASFYYIRERKWWFAGVFGFFAALTRVEGVLARRPVRHRVAALAAPNGRAA